MSDTPPTPQQAENALTDIRHRQRAAINAAYDTPWWYFAGLGAAVLLISGMYLAGDWFENRVGVVATGVGYIAAVAAFSAWLGVLLRMIGRRQRAKPPAAALSWREVIIGIVGYVVALAAVFAAVVLGSSDEKLALSAMLAVVAVTVAFGGRPLQAVIRRRALRALDDAGPKVES